MHMSSRRNGVLTQTGTALRLVLSSIGPKSGQDLVLAMLLESTDLPDDGWKFEREHTFRTGAGKSATEEIRRARKDGSISARRRFKNAALHRGMWISVSPYASSSDAKSSLSNFLG